MFKHGSIYLTLEKGVMQLSNNGINLFYVEKDDYKNCVKFDYNGLEDNIMINIPLYLKNIMKLKINKNIIPTYLENIIDNNMDNYLYTIEGKCNKSEKIYTINNHDKKLILIQKNDNMC